MKDHHHKVHRPLFKQYRKPDVMPTQDCVRVYRSSPDRVTLQIRADNKHLSASLPFSTIQWLIDALNDASQGMPGPAMTEDELRKLITGPHFINQGEGT